MKGGHTVLLCKMEEGRVSWDRNHKIDRIRMAHAQKVQKSSGSKRTHFKDTPTPCRPQWQSGNTLASHL